MEDVRFIQTDAEILECYPILNLLHDDIDKSSIVQTFRRLEKEYHYQLVALFEGNEIKSVAGFHISESFAWQKFIYINELVTDVESRSKGYGAKMLNWIKKYAIENGCQQIHVDTRVTRYQTHKFYLNQGLYLGGYHFLNTL